MSRRDAILNGTARASQLHEDLGLKNRLRAGDEPIDVLGAMASLDIAVVFKPLKGLLGAYLRVPGAAGVVITSERPLHVQRFTAAHELGHHVFEHPLSTDSTVGYAARGERRGYDENELEADAFASEFLMPRWLIAAHMRRRSYTKQDLFRTDVIYQLSLRLAVSYSALCWALYGHGLFAHDQAEQMASREPKGAKQMAAADVVPQTWHPDVWALSERDHRSIIIGGPEDLVVLELEEHSTAGFAWDLREAKALGMRIRADERVVVDEEAMGAAQKRRLTLEGDVQGILRLAERRPWERNGQPNQSFEVRLDLHGRERGGMPRAQRAALRKTG
ncbi:ImmA/IrrE family metallo-endopeptidase [Ramlibacter sp.]|uniref:ImmA/IrrE family metallo-endopeptidase n=1 Tax=Ramlibacter sp. TaxID=1917967 RepID=UPI002C36AE46|nr:ImmA/IrrE family metallo-endopeptidase [Ramlibacter sp.]HWI81573.1 ImmA/IrrE family metallo-endopeptidase [Ramlibacter sp.]